LPEDTDLGLSDFIKGGGSWRDLRNDTKRGLPDYCIRRRVARKGGRVLQSGVIQMIRRDIVRKGGGFDRGNEKRFRIVAEFVREGEGSETIEEGFQKRFACHEGFHVTVSKKAALQ
jgi:hypothetical protein